MTDSPDQLLKECDEVLLSKQKDVCKEWLKEAKPSEGAVLRQERLRSAMVASAYLVERHMFSQQHKRLLMTAIHYYKFVRKKLMNYIYTIKFFSEKDFECKYVLQMLIAPDVPHQTAEMYLKTRKTILSGVLNPRKKEQLSGVTAPLEEWFTIVSQIYQSANAKQLLDKFTQIVKHHYSEIKKDQNIDLNGAEVLNIVAKLSEHYPETFSKVVRKSAGKNSTQHLPTQPRGDDMVRTQQHRNDKIQGLLEFRHHKMVKEMTDEVEELRENLRHEQQRVKKLNERDKYFVNFLKQTKQEVFDLAELILEKRFDPPALDKLLKRFEQFETNIERKESVEMVRINNRRDELKLIEEIMQEEMMLKEKQMSQ